MMGSLLDFSKVSLKFVKAPMFLIVVDALDEILQILTLLLFSGVAGAEFSLVSSVTTVEKEVSSFLALWG